MKFRRIDFYPDDWLAGVSELDDTERGVYITICALIYARGEAITFELLKSASLSHGLMLNRCIRRLKTLGKISEKQGRITQERCEKELKRRRELSEKARRNGSKGGRPNELEKPDGFAFAKPNNLQSTINNQQEGFPNGNLRARARKTPPIPLAEWQPSEAHQQLAHEEGRDDLWLAREAERYRDQQANASRKHKDREAGFRNWIRNAPLFEGSANGHGRQTSGRRTLSAVDNLFLGAARAAEAIARRRGDSGTPVAPLLDSGRRSGDPTSSD